MNELALFAGAGGGILGGDLLGWRTICAVEWEPYPASVLCARQNDGILPSFPIWDDVQTFDGRPWRGRVDVVSGGFPCQDISAAGKGAGIDGERSGMWGHMARIVREVEPRFVFVENSPMLTSRGLGRVLGDLAALGYDARWGVLGAHHAGAPHKRDRIWIVAHATNRQDLERERGDMDETAQGREGCHTSVITCSPDVADAARLQQGREEQRAQRERTRPSGESIVSTCSSDVADTGCDRRKQDAVGEPLQSSAPRFVLECEKGAGGSPREVSVPHSDDKRLQRGIQEVSTHAQGRQKQGYGCTSERCSGREGNGRDDWWLTEPDVGRVAHGVAARVDRLKAIGNGQVPAVAALAWEILSADLAA